MKFHEYQQHVQVRAGDIQRHPVVQRFKDPQQRDVHLARFTRKLGEFDASKAAFTPVQLVRAPGDAEAAFYAIDGATRTELCQRSPKHGSEHKLACVVYGNGVPPTQQELAELFLELNCHRFAPSASVEFKAAVQARERSAVIAAKLLTQLTSFKGEVGLWNLVKKFGERITTDGVTFATGAWPRQHIPVMILGAVVTALGNDDTRRQLLKRQKPLKSKSAEHWLAQAQNKALQQIGKRDSAAAYALRVILGQRS